MNKPIAIALIAIKGEFKDQHIMIWDYNKYNPDEAYNTAIYFIDKLLVTMEKKSLIVELNEMQHEVNGDKRFENKFTIPLYFVNLLLEKHNMKLQIITNYNV